MHLRNFLGSKENETHTIMEKFVGSAFNSIKNQMSFEPLCNIQFSSIDKLRCRLCLYSMNFAYLNWFIIHHIGPEKGLNFVDDFQNNLVEVIFQNDSEIVDKLEKLVLDKKFYEKLKTEASERNVRLQGRFSYLLKIAIFADYLSNRMEEYYFAIGEWEKTNMRSDPNLVNHDLMVDQITKVFVKNYFGSDFMANFEFSLSFTLNVSMNSFTFFSNEVERFLR